MVLLDVIIFPVCMVNVSETTILSSMFKAPLEVTLFTRLPRTGEGILAIEIDETLFVNSIVLVAVLMTFVPISS